MRDFDNDARRGSANDRSGIDPTGAAHRDSQLFFSLMRVICSSPPLVYGSRVLSTVTRIPRFIKGFSVHERLSYVNFFGGEKNKLNIESIFAIRRSVV